MKKSTTRREGVHTSIFCRSKVELVKHCDTLAPSPSSLAVVLCYSTRDRKIREKKGTGRGIVQGEALRVPRRSGQRCCGSSLASGGVQLQHPASPVPSTDETAALLSWGIRSVDGFIAQLSFGSKKYNDCTCWVGGGGDCKGCMLEQKVSLFLVDLLWRASWRGGMPSMDSVRGLRCDGPALLRELTVKISKYRTWLVSRAAPTHPTVSGGFFKSIAAQITRIVELFKIHPRG